MSSKSNDNIQIVPISEHKNDHHDLPPIMSSNTDHILQSVPTSAPSNDHHLTFNNTAKIGRCHGYIVFFQSKENSGDTFVILLLRWHVFLDATSRSYPLIKSCWVDSRRPFFLLYFLRRAKDNQQLKKNYDCAFTIFAYINAYLN